MDVAILSMPRSGTTMLSGLMTHGDYLMLDEPRVYEDRRWHKHESKIKASTLWGAKEVNARNIDETLKAFRIPQIICMVRDVRSIMASYHDAVKIYGMPWPQEAEGHARYVARTAERCIQLSDVADVMVVRYEEFVSHQKSRDALSSWMSWPLEGDPGQYQMNRPGRQRRSFERDKHCGYVTDKSVRERLSYASDEQRHWAEAGQKACAEYQRHFGYE